MTKLCKACGKTEEGWKYNRCPNCGEMAANPPRSDRDLEKDLRELAGYAEGLVQQLSDRGVTLGIITEERDQLKIMLVACRAHVKAMEKDHASPQLQKNKH